MTHSEATRLLDMAQDGQPVPQEAIQAALDMTGDGPDTETDRELEDFLADLRQAGLL